MDTDRRIVIEGVEFAQLVQFPRILRAVTSAFQLPRLLLGLLLVAAVVTGGRVWDMLFTATVSPAGLMAEPWTAQDAANSQQVLQAALDRYGIAAEDSAPVDGVLEASEVLAQVRSAYSTQRDALLGQAADSEEGEAALRKEREAALRDGDNGFLETIEQLDDVRPRGMYEATAHHVTTGFNRLTRGLVSLEIGEFFSGLGDVFVRTPIGVRLRCTHFR